MVKRNHTKLGHTSSELAHSLIAPHPETQCVENAGLTDWIARLPDDPELVDIRSGTPVKWVRGNGWAKMCKRLEQT